MSLLDAAVSLYQEKGDSSKIIEGYAPFIQKYQALLGSGKMDLGNYDMRKFISCFISDRRVVDELSTKKAYSQHVMSCIHETIDYIRWAIKGMSPQEIYADLLILFLECAREYEDFGSGFRKYIYHVFRYRLKKYIDDRLENQNVESKLMERYSGGMESEIESIIDSQYAALEWSHVEEQEADCNNPHWLNGKTCSDYFKPFSYHDRFVIYKYYEEGLTDKEISKISGFHHRSIYRIRKRVVDTLRLNRVQGEIKCLR